MGEHLERLFPGLTGTAFRVTSPPSTQYNCIAWAVGDTQNWWWPDLEGEDRWPDGVPREESIEAFQSAFAALGFVPCSDEAPEEGFEKIALYAYADGRPTHAARQLAAGRWTSKLGQMEDIEHGLGDLAGLEYGSVLQLMKRPLPTTPH